MSIFFDLLSFYQGIGCNDRHGRPGKIPEP
jgi:hypothetical protein